MNCILRVILCLSLSGFLNCTPKPPLALNSYVAGNSPGVVSQPSISQNFDPRLISTLQKEQKRSVKLNDLVKNMENSTFYINDNIVFSTNENKEENKNITLHIQTQCIEPETQKKFTKNVSLKYKNEIMLIELIPEKLFSYGNSWWLSEKIHNPTCSFHFEAKNKAGDIHFFELPHLPILSFNNSLNLSLIEQQAPSNEVERVAQFPMLKFDQIENYAVISGKNTIVDQLKLICETFDLSFNVDNLIHYDLWKLQGWTSIEQEDRINQPCRFVSFHNEYIVGVSQLFPIVFRAQGLNIQLITDPDKVDVSKNRYSLGVSGYGFEGTARMKSDFKRDHNLKTYYNVVVLKFENTSIDQVHLYIPEASFYTDIHFFYDSFIHKVHIKGRVHTMDDQGMFITMKNSAQFILTPSLIKAKNHSMRINGERHYIVYEGNHALITIESGATALIPLSVDIENQCSFRKKKFVEKQRILKYVESAGMVFEGNMIPIYQVLDATDVESAKNTIINSITTNSPQQNLNSFRLDVTGSFAKENIDKYFYKNTCAAFRVGIFDQASIGHQGAWKVKFRNKKVQFIKATEQSLLQEQHKFARQIMK